MIQYRKRSSALRTILVLSAYIMFNNPVTTVGTECQFAGSAPTRSYSGMSGGVRVRLALSLDSRGIVPLQKEAYPLSTIHHGWVSPHCGQQVIEHSLLHSLYCVIVKFHTTFLSSLPFNTFVNSLPHSCTVFLLTYSFPLFRPFYLLAGSSPLTLLYSIY